MSGESEEAHGDTGVSAVLVICYSAVLGLVSDVWRVHQGFRSHVACAPPQTPTAMYMD